MSALLSEVLFKKAQPQHLASLIQLLPLEHNHAQKILALMDDDISHKLGRAPCTNLSQAISYIYDRNSTQPARLAIYHQAFGVIGVISFGLPKKLPLEAVIGYWIGKPYQHKGYARQAIRALLNTLEKLKITRVLAEVYPGNIRSENLLESLGFFCEDKNLLINDQYQYYLQLSDVYPIQTINKVKNL